MMPQIVNRGSNFLLHVRGPSEASAHIPPQCRADPRLVQGTAGDTDLQRQRSEFEGADLIPLCSVAQLRAEATNNQRRLKREKICLTNASPARENNTSPYGSLWSL